MEKWMWWALGALLLIGGGSVVMYNKTRGWRNNNPGNLRPGGGNWVGLIGIDDAGKQGKYLKFDTPEHGVRAMAINLLNYQRLHGINTIAGIVNRYANAEDNNPEKAYANYVAKAVGISPTQQINIRDHLKPLVHAMVKFENAGITFPEVVDAGLKLVS